MNRDEKRRAALLTKIGTAATARNKAKAEAERVEERVLMPLVVQAVEAGMTLREVGEAAGVSHVTVMRMLQRRGYNVGS